ncbi:MAG TPA: choice-of-anchor B family protein [Phycisphaerae bacterium]
MKHTLVWPKLVALLVLPTLTLGHEDPKHEQDYQPPYSGPGWDPTEGGVPPITFSSSGIQLLSWLPVTQFNPAATSGNVAWGYVSPSGREYAIMGFSHGTAFVEVTNPSNAQIRAIAPGPVSLWRDLKTYQHYCYAVSEGGSGIQVMDLDNIDAGGVIVVGSVTTPSGTTTSTHTVAVNEASGYLYRCGGGGFLGVRIYSLANPANPTYVTTALTTRYTHEAQIVSYTSGPYAGKEIAFCCTENTSGGGAAGINILDVTNKASIVQLASYAYPNALFSHQGWLSTDRHYFYLDDEFDEAQLGIPSTTHVIDVLNLASPTQVATFSTGSTAIDHNLYTLGNLIFESNYRSGLRVFDSSADQLHPTQIAWFDTYPPDDIASYNALWSNYPYLPSGIILGGDIEKGLFVWRLGLALLAISYPNGLPQFIDPPGASVLVSIAPQNGGSVQPGTEKLHYNAGAGDVEVDLLPVSGDLYQAVFPSLPCSTVVSYYFSAQASNGDTVRDPMTAPIGTYQTTVAAGEVIHFFDDMETDMGWTVGALGDNATAGIWVRVDPVGSAAQPEDDHTAAGTMCWVTGQNVPNSPASAGDVDGGKTTLLTPITDLSAMGDATISYWRWYSNNTGSLTSLDDTFVIDISNNGGGSWVNVETLGPGGGIDNLGGWRFHKFRVADYVPQTSQMRMRFVASDMGAVSNVEAAIDDFKVSVVACIHDDWNADGHVDLTDYGAFAGCMAGPNATPAPAPPLTATGCLSAFDSDADSDLDLLDAAELQDDFTG